MLLWHDVKIRALLIKFLAFFIQLNISYVLTGASSSFTADASNEGRFYTEIPEADERLPNTEIPVSQVMIVIIIDDNKGSLKCNNNHRMLPIWT